MKLSAIKGALHAVHQPVSASPLNLLQNSVALDGREFCQFLFPLSNRGSLLPIGLMPATPRTWLRKMVGHGTGAWRGAAGSVR